MYYIRFTSDIYADIENGHSSHFSTGAKLDGLCAWNVNDSDLNEYSTEEEIINSAKATAEMIARNTYGGYSSRNTYAVLEGTYAGSSNDGVCIDVKKVIAVKEL